jgi:RHS repeat-associated protein
MPELLMDSDDVYIYGPGGSPFEQVNMGTGNIDYLVADALGSVRGVVAGSWGGVIASTSYDAWGNPETPGGLTAYTPFGFAGGYTDSTGLIYFINRYYDPATGSFTSIDPDVERSGGAYVYASDDPVTISDPSGLLPSAGMNETNVTLQSIASAYETFEGEQDICSAISELGTIEKTITKADNSLQSDYALESLLTSGGQAPPSFLITEIEQTFQSLSSNLASEGQYLASVAFAGYNYLAGKQGTQELVDDAVQLQEVADQAVGTSEEISTAVAASDGWALAGDSAVSDIFNLEDLMSALIGD